MSRGRGWMELGIRNLERFIVEEGFLADCADRADHGDQLVYFETHYNYVIPFLI